MEDPGWAVRYLAVDTGKWLSGKHVLIAPDWIEQIDWATQEVRVLHDVVAIEAAPVYDLEKVISHAYQVALYEHYGQRYEQD